MSLEGLPEPERRKARQKLMEAAIEAKMTLNSEAQMNVAVAYVLPKKHIETVLTRAEVEESIRCYRERVEGTLEGLMARSGLSMEQVDRVIPVGGSSQISSIRHLLGGLFGPDRLFTAPAPTLGVVEGAALYAAYRDDADALGRRLSIVRRTCHAIGIEGPEGRFLEVIPANQKAPCGCTKLFKTTVADLSTLTVAVYQGSKPLAKDNAMIGTLIVADLPKRGAGTFDIWLTFRLDEELRLTVTARIEPGPGFDFQAPFQVG
jgi:molecular chaperone DnaK